MKKVLRTLGVLALGGMLAACGNNAGTTKQTQAVQEMEAHKLQKVRVQTVLPM